MKEIIVLGSNCPNCKKLAENVREAIKLSGHDLRFSYMTDIIKIMEYGVLMPPGLVLDGEVKSNGHVLSVEEIVDIINNKD